jgi:helicase
LDTGFNLVIQAPTGSGKTWMAKEMIKKTLKKGGKAVFLTPLRALASELHTSWCDTFETQSVGIFTGDFGSGKKIAEPRSFGESDILIMTPERLDACTRFWRHHWHWLPSVELLIIDEIHLLLDSHRGPRLEGALSRFRRLNPFTRIVMLSATIGNLHELSDWIDGVAFKSTWRPIQLKWDYVFFKKADEKPTLLYNTVIKNIQTGGQSLVFVQSRRRAVDLSSKLRDSGILSDAHHAGFDHAQRTDIENRFRSKSTKVLVTTSTLEMGLNLPARQVVLYDLQEFNGHDFVPLSTVSVWQRGGRAGRPGLDSTGEVVLFVPAWQKGGVKNYEKGNFEHIKTSTSEDAQLTEQILAEIATRLSRSSTQIYRNMQKSLSKIPLSQKLINEKLDAMLLGGFLVRREEISYNIDNQLLTATKLGRVAVRHMLSPQTVQTLNRVMSLGNDFSFFDLALTVSATLDCQPVLHVDFDSLTNLATTLNIESSAFLSNCRLLETLGVNGKRMLSALKMAAILREWTRFGVLDDLSSEYDVYPFELRRLFESASRIIQGWIALFELKKDTTIEINDYQAAFLEKLKAFQIMLEQGLNEEQVSLTFIKGIGPKWAKKIAASGITDVEELALCSPDQLLSLGNIKQSRAEVWISDAEEAVKEHSAYTFKEMKQKNLIVGHTTWDSDIDPYRLRRSIDLSVEQKTESSFFVSGGLEPHQVNQVDGHLSCDCMDFKKGHYCKHKLAVKSFVGDSNILTLLERINPKNGNQSLDLNTLWYGVSS